MIEQSKSYIDQYGTIIWYLPSKGKAYWHRTDGPAIENLNGHNGWWVNGKRHRTDGPAIEEANGTKAWLMNGKWHRTDGPAYEDINGTKYWIINGKDITGEVEEWIKEFNIDMDTDEGKMRFKLTWC